MKQHMISKYILGIDVGTTNIKAVLFDIEGKEIDKQCEKNPIIKNHNGLVEQDMDKTWSITVNCIRKLLSKSLAKQGKIESVGITSQGEGLWILDKNRKPLRNAILWNDCRAYEIIERIGDSNLNNKIRKITGSLPYAGGTAFLLKWLKENEIHVFNKIGYVLSCKDFIRYKLTNEIFMDYSDASTSLLNLANDEISIELLKILDIEEMYVFFPTLRNSFLRGGLVTEEGEKLTGIKKGTTVAIGMLDVVASAIGSGAIKSGDICTVLGTTACNAVITDEIRILDDSSGFERFAEENVYVNVIGAMSGMKNLTWFIENFYKTELKEANLDESNIYTILEKRIENESAVNKGVIYHPYISDSGERAPFYDVNARAQFFGICEDVSKDTLLRAIYEGIAFSIRDCLLNYKNSKEIYLSGGGSNSNVWPQIIADITGKNVVISDCTEYAAKGAAISGAICAGIYKDLEEATETCIRERKVFYPNEGEREKYDKFYELYVQIRKMNVEFWNKRNLILKSIREGVKSI